MKSISSALQTILDSRNFMMEDLYTITLIDGTVVRLTSGQQPIVMASSTFSEETPTDDEYGRIITIDYTKISEDLTDFPAPVLITDADDPIFTNAGSNGYDIWFDDIDGNVLDYERAIWDPENHIALFYVRIPSVSSTEDTLFHMYYGDTVARTEDESNRTEAWDDNFAAVYHLVTDPSTGTLADSTANERNLYVNGSMLASQLESSVLGRGWRFDGVNDEAGDDNALSIDSGTGYTIEFLFRSSSASTLQKLMYWARAATGIWFHCTLNDDSTNNRVKFQAKDVAGDQYFIADGYDVTADMHAAFTITSPGALKGFINGAQAGSDVALSTITGNYITALRIGSNLGFDQFFDGLLSEVRFSNVARSAGWLAATYHGLMGTLLTIGAEDEEE